MTITIRRTGAFGDVLCLTPIVRRIRQDYPTTPLVIETGYQHIFAGNPDLPHQEGEDQVPDQRYDFDLAYERQPNMHVVDAYFLEFLCDPPNEQKTLYFKRTMVWNNPKTVVIHAAKSWASRTFHYEFWNRVAEGVRGQGLKPVFVGTLNDYGGPLWATNTLGALNIDQVAGLIAGAAMFVGSDSGLLHLAGTTETPIVGLYTSVRAKYRMPYRHGELGWNMVAIEPPEDLTCRGCLERAPAPATNLLCARGDNICTRSIIPPQVLDAIKALRAAHTTA